MDHADLTPATRLVTLGRTPGGAPEPGGPVNPPMVLSSTYRAGAEPTYARVGNPTWTAFEETLGSLEGGTAVAFASGMAAVAAVLSTLPLGAVVVAPEDAYSGTCSLLEDLESAGHLVVRRVRFAEMDRVREALRGADLVWVESPSNPLVEVADVARIVREAHDTGAQVACDNTFATPLRARPLELGADLVIHSATKYLAGHSDVLLGAVVTPNDADGPALRDRIHRHRTLHGAVPGPFETWLALRGLRTLHVRLDRAEQNARALVERLRVHPRVDRVRYPGFGGIISIEVGPGAEDAERVAGSTSVWMHSTSLGGVESQIERRRRHPAEPSRVPVTLLRLSVGVEDVEDLWQDLDQALRSTSPA